MSRPPRGVSAPTVYELRLGGHVDEHWSTWFDGLAIIHQDDGTTTLRGAVADQAELHGLLARVRDLGATLISVTPTEISVTPADISVTPSEAVAQDPGAFRRHRTARR